MVGRSDLVKERPRNLEIAAGGVACDCVARMLKVAVQLGAVQ